MYCSHTQKILLSVLLGLGSIVSAQTLSKPALRRNLDDIENALTFALPVPGYKQSVWNFGEIAEPCKFEAIENKLNPNQILTYNITYNDCAIPYVFCVHANAPTPLHAAITAFGKVPARMRQYVRTISFFAGGGNGYARGSDIVVFGDLPKVGIYVHEITHVTEFSNAFASNAQMTDQQPWKNGYNQDTAVPDDYARTNQHENLAQHPMFILYQDNIGDINQVEPNFNRISGQQFILRVEGQNGKNDGKLFAVKGVSCSYRHPFPLKVSTQTTLRRRALSRIESANATYQVSKNQYDKVGITVIDPNTLPKEAAGKKTACKFH